MSASTNLVLNDPQLCWEMPLNQKMDMAQVPYPLKCAHFCAFISNSQSSKSLPMLFCRFANEDRAPGKLSINSYSIAIANRKGQKEENTLKIPMAWWYSFISFVWKIERTNKMKICLFNLKSIYTSCCLCRAAWLAAQSQSRPGRRPMQTWASLVGGDRRERGTRMGSELTRTKTQLPRATEARKSRRRESCGGS